MECDKVKILNLQISKNNLNDILEEAARLIEQGDKFYVCAPNAFLTVKANEDKELLNIINNARFAIPDGMSSVWVSKVFNIYPLDRISGYDFFYNFSKIANNKGYSYFFMGGSDNDTLERIIKKLKSEFNNIKISGYFSPPFFKDNVPDEINENIINLINSSNTDILWVGLSAPKQEKWIYKNIERLDIKMACGIGAVFDFYSGNVKRAPKWMQDNGLEWLFRVFTEPKRLFRKYLIYNTKFMILVLKDFIKRDFRVK